MKHIIRFTAALLLCLCLVGCTPQPTVQIAATTLPVYEFTARLCHGTPLSVTRLITDDVSCLHDYTLQTNQMRTAEEAELVVISGAGLEIFLDDLQLDNNKIIDASQNITLHCSDASEEHNHHDHHHEEDPHIWLSPALAQDMCRNICTSLAERYPENADIFNTNLAELINDLDKLSNYAHEQLSQLLYRELITFHDGFSYMAEAFDLSIIHAIEEESGSEASAAELIHIIRMISDHNLSAIFTESNGSTSAAGIITRETNAKTYVLDMCMSGNSYFESMYKNIDTLKEALG